MRGFGGKSPPFHATFWIHLQKRFLYTELVYKLGCEAAMKVRGDDTLEGAHSFVALLEANLLLFALLFRNTYRDGLYTLGRYTNFGQRPKGGHSIFCRVFSSTI